MNDHSKTSLGKLELAGASALTLAAAYLHVRFLNNAGGLWRDEVVSYNVAAQASLAQMFEAVRYDSFPSFFHVVLRAWLSLGGDASDTATRTLGLLIGLSVLCACWWSARAFGGRLPLFSLLLLGISGLCVRTTDSIRAYGAGVACIALCFGLVWRVANKPSRGNVLLAGACAILAVQSLYQNAFLLAAICLAGILVAARRGAWKRVGLIVGIGACAALSLTLYIPAMAHMGEIKSLIAAHAGLGRILGVALAALRDGSNLRLALWLVLLAGYLGFAVHALRKREQADAASNEVVVFTLTAVVTALAGFLVWLRVLGFPTQPWYYVPPMAIVCLAADAAWPALFGGQKAAGARLGVVLAGGFFGFFAAHSALEARQTNVDVLAERLRALAAPGDFILVDQWYNGASFSRYYGGQARWSTLPPLEDQTLQRLDLFKRYMVASKPTEPVERQMADALKAGHRVWLAGGLPLPSKGQAPIELPPAPNSPVGWDHDAYSITWARNAGAFLQSRAQKAARVSIGLEGPVSEYENLPLWVVQGWREEQRAVAALRPAAAHSNAAPSK